MSDSEVTVRDVQHQGLSLAAVGLDEGELADAVKRTLLINYAAQFLCRHYGPKDGCQCRGNEAHCHAHILWEDEARVVVTGFERIGAIK
jgi:hypothetical protein